MTNPKHFHYRQLGTAYAVLTALIGLLLSPATQAQQSSQFASERPQLHLQIGHKQVNQVLLSPKGKLVASTGDDLAIKIWDVLTGDLKLTITYNDLLTGKREFVTEPQLKFIADSRALRVRFRMASREEKYTEMESVIVYDLQTGKSIPDPDKANGLCPADEELIATAPDGNASVCLNGQDAKRLLLRKRAATEAVPLVEGFDPSSYQAVFSPDSKTLILDCLSDFLNLPLKLWDVATGKVLREIGERGFEGFLDNGQVIALYRRPFDPRHRMEDRETRLNEAEKNGAVELWDPYCAICITICRAEGC